MSVAAVIVGIAAWIAFTLIVPIGLAILFPLWARRRRFWPAHLLFAPCFLALQWGMIWIIFWAADDRGEGSPGLGFLMLPGLALSALVLGGYYIVLLFEIARKALR